MQVLQFSKFYPPVRGGIESATRELTEGLIRQGVQADVLCANRGRHSERDPLAPGCQVVRVGKWGTLLSTSMAQALVGHLRRMAAGEALPTAADLAAAPRRRDRCHQRRLPHLDASQPLQPWKAKVRVIPIGVADLAARVDAIRRRHGGRRLVFALGRMAYYKGFDVLVDAAARLPDDALVLIGGAGALHDTLQQRIDSRGLGARVRLLGGIPKSELPDHFAACDLFCMPSTSRAEAFGIAMVEAMMFGKPVVAAAIPGSGVPWINEEGVTGFNVPVGQPAPLAEALSRLLSQNGLRQRMGQAARHRYLCEFTADRMAERTLELYRSLLA